MDAAPPPTTSAPVTPADPPPASPEVAAPRPGRVETWARRNPIDAIAGALVLVHLVIRSAWVSDTYLSEDDFTLIARISGKSLNWTLLTQDDAGHLAPGRTAMFWAANQLAPFERWPTAVFTVALLAIAAGLFWRLLRRLFGATPGMLVPLTLYLFWAMTTSTTLWWSTTTLWIPLHIALSASLLGLLRYLETPRLRYAVGTTGAVVFGLLFFEKALVVPIVLVAFTYFYAVHGGPWQRLRRTLRVAAPLWAMLGALSIGYVVIYLTAITRVDNPPSSLGKLLHLAQNVMIRSFATEAWGGPWSWGDNTDLNSAHAAPSSGMTWLAAGLCLAVLALSAFSGLRASGAWAILVGYLVIDVLLLGFNRLEFIGAPIGLTDRYISDVAVIGALAIGLAFLPMNGTGAPPGRPPATPRSGPLTWLDRNPMGAGFVVAAVVAAVTVSSTVSAAALHAKWVDSPTERYFTNLRADLRAAKTPPDMYSRPVPTEVVNGLIAPSNQLKALVDSMPEKANFPLWTHEFVMPDLTGRLRPGTVNEDGIVSQPGKAPNCGWKVTTKPVDIPLVKPTINFTFLMRIGYLSGPDTPADITFAGKTTRVQLRNGLHELYIEVTGVGGSVRISGLAPGANVCVGGVTVGQPIPRVP